MRLAIVQSKPRKGDLDGNAEALGAIFAQLARDPEPYDLVVLPEAALTGYFLEGGVYALARSASETAERIAGLWHRASGASRRAVDVVLGFYENADGTYYNSALYVRVEADGGFRIVHVHRKLFLPTYGVFDEARFLSRGRRIDAFDTSFGRAAILICEDAWHSIVPMLAAIKGARVLIVPSASPGRGFGGHGELESLSYWRNVVRSYAVEHGVFAIYAGLAGFEGGKGMAGSSFAIDPFGDTIGELPTLGAHVLRADLDLTDVDLARSRLPLLGDLSSVLPDLLADALAAARPLEVPK